MRSRNIKPAFFKNDDLAELSIETRLLFIGLWCIADREGRLEDRPKRIKAEVFPYDSVDVDPMLSKLESTKMLIRYEVDGTQYIYIKNFVKHQSPHYKEKASEIPPPHGMSDEIIATGVTRAQRLEVLERDGFKCLFCGSTSHLCIDHIIPVSRGGDSSTKNLQTLCMSCNTTKGNKLVGEDRNVKKGCEDSYKQEFGPNSIQGRINVGLKEAAIDPLIPDLLIPDSLIPDSCIGGKAKPAPKKKVFVKPLLSDVFNYCKERNNSVDHEKWFDHYESNGWKVGKNPMKDWKAAVRTWERSSITENGKQQTQAKPQSNRERDALQLIGGMK